MRVTPNARGIYEQMNILRERMVGHTVPNYFGTGRIQMTEPWNQSL